MPAGGKQRGNGESRAGWTSASTMLPQLDDWRAAEWEAGQDVSALTNLPQAREDFPPLVPPFNVLEEAESLAGVRSRRTRVYLPNTPFRLDGVVDMDK